jgi:hypothetical protein
LTFWAHRPARSAQRACARPSFPAQCARYVVPRPDGNDYVHLLEVHVSAVWRGDSAELNEKTAGNFQEPAARRNWRRVFCFWGKLRGHLTHAMEAIAGEDAGRVSVSTRSSWQRHGRHLSPLTRHPTGKARRMSRCRRATLLRRLPTDGRARHTLIAMPSRLRIKERPMDGPNHIIYVVRRRK